MAALINKLPKHTYEFTLSIPWTKVKDSYDKTVKKVAESTELPGFRKGKAPLNLVEEKIDKSKIYEEVIQDVVPPIYADALKEHNIKPITTPKVELIEAKEGSDWKIKATVAEKPDVNLADYTKIVAKAKTGKEKIWLPGKGEPENDEKKKDATLEEVLKTLLADIPVEIPDMLVEEEANRLLSRLIDETKQLGLTVDQYLQSTGKSADQVRQEYMTQAERTIKLEFILEAIADKEKISVSETEISDAINKVKDEKERENLRKQSYYLATILRRQKTLDTLLKPIV